MMNWRVMLMLLAPPFAASAETPCGTAADPRLTLPTQAPIGSMGGAAGCAPGSVASPGGSALQDLNRDTMHAVPAPDLSHALPVDAN
jgi:hypothetical protein